MKYFLFSLIIIVLISGCGNTLVTQGAESSVLSPATNSNPFQTVYVAGRNVNLRQGPGTQYAIVGSVFSGDSLLVTGEATDWYKVYIPDKSLFAWIYAGLTTGAVLPH